ncbi:hypothetical protein C8Q76DRAFT_769475 [Earliella scabrosa]|nr:hypothetical protein C8Q76DRAFT_769475 [Earliella scabrosa]
MIFCAWYGPFIRPSPQPHDLNPTVKAYIDRAIVKALRDPVGRRDFAVYAGGARVIPDLTLGFSRDGRPLPSTTSSPSAAISDEFHLDSCWDIPGASAQLGVQLSEMIHPTHVSIDHIPLEIAPDISRAPKAMVLWGALDGGYNGDVFNRMTQSSSITLATHEGRSGPKVAHNITFIPLASFEYNIRADFHIQTFTLDRYIIDSDLYFGVVVLDILGNWGGDSTCLYRFRVHGERTV